MCMIVSACLCVRVLRAYNVQKRVWDPLELKVAMVLGHLVGVGDGTRIFSRSSQYS